jgi:hypothetical protein
MIEKEERRLGGGGGRGAETERTKNRLWRGRT